MEFMVKGAIAIAVRADDEAQARAIAESLATRAEQSVNDGVTVAGCGVAIYTVRRARVPMIEQHHPDAYLSGAARAEAQLGEGS